MGYKSELQSNNVDLQSILDAILALGLVNIPMSELLVDFSYSENTDDTATITGWNGTHNGDTTTEMVIPNVSRIIL